MTFFFQFSPISSCSCVQHLFFPVRSRFCVVLLTTFEKPFLDFIFPPAPSFPDPKQQKFAPPSPFHSLETEQVPPPFYSFNGQGSFQSVTNFSYWDVACPFLFPCSPLVLCPFYWSMKCFAPFSFFFFLKCFVPSLLSPRGVHDAFLLSLPRLAQVNINHVFPVNKGALPLVLYFFSPSNMLDQESCPISILMS